MPGFAEIDGEPGTAWAVLGVAVFVLAAGIMEYGEEADNFLVGGVLGGHFGDRWEEGELTTDLRMDGFLGVVSREGRHHETGEC